MGVVGSPNPLESQLSLIVNVLIVPVADTEIGLALPAVLVRPPDVHPSAVPPDVVYVILPVTPSSMLEVL